MPVEIQRSVEIRKSAEIRKGVATALLTVALFVGATPARADRYDPKESGHPLRIVAYVIHPVGVLLDTLIFRPAHWMVSHDGLRYWFGHIEK